MKVLVGFCVGWAAAQVALGDSVTFWRVRSIGTPATLTELTDGTLTWTHAEPGRTDKVERATQLMPGDWRDYVWVPATGSTMAVQVLDPQPPPGMRRVPAGIFQMGDAWNEGGADEQPVHSVYLGAFYLDQFPVTLDMWTAVAAWSADHGYDYDQAGSGKGGQHPVHSIHWYDAVKWCNARSQMEGRTPVYYTDSALTEVYRSSRAVPYVRWSANGYRLPTEAEWEKAARGGMPTNRLAWWDANTIDHARANYRGYPAGYPFDLAADGYHPDHASGGTPYTSPVGSFESGRSGYDLYDMAGNVWEWCWDWYDGTWYDHPQAAGPEPRGPDEGAYRVVRGGAWSYDAWGCRAAYRFSHPPTYAWNHLGFRTVRLPDP